MRLRDPRRIEGDAAMRRLKMKSRVHARLGFGAVLAALLVVGAACSSSSGSSSGSAGAGKTTTSAATIPVGIVEDLSGPDSAQTASSVPGLELAVQQVNQAGLTIGGKPYKLKLSVCDAQSQSSVAASCAQKLVSDDGVVTLFGTQYPDGASTIPVSQHAGIIQFTVTDAADPDLTATGSCCLLIAYGTSPATRDTTQLQSTAEFAKAANPSYTTMAVLMPNIAAFHTIVNGLVKLAPAAGIKVVSVNYYTEGLTDFSGVLTSLSSSHPDIILDDSGNQVDDGAILREALNLGVGKVFSFPGISTGIVQSTVGKPISEPVIVWSSGVSFDPAVLTTDPAVAAFVSQMTKYLGGKLPADNPEGTLVYYDTLKMWVQALRQAGCVPGQGSDSTPDACTKKVMQTLLSMNYTGVSGPRHYTAAHYLVMGSDVCEIVNGKTTCKAFGV
jgi:branched-chain amino acid transport system substrate-binding protein